MPYVAYSASPSDLSPVEAALEAERLEQAARAERRRATLRPDAMFRRDQQDDQRDEFLAWYANRR